MDTFAKIEAFWDPAYVNPDGSYDWYPAVMRAQSSWASAETPSGFSLYFGPQTYTFSQSLHLVRGMSLIGSGEAGWLVGTRLVFNLDADGKQQTGIFCDSPQTAPEAYPGFGAWSIVERMGIFPQSASRGAPNGPVPNINEEAHGVFMCDRMKLRDVYISGFEGDGVHIQAFHENPNRPSNANGWQLENCRIDNCGRHGVYVIGSDANAGCAIAVDCGDNKGWGFLDESFLGNTYIACQTANCARGAYCVVDRNARSLFLNCYSENDQPPSQIPAPSVVLGGIMNVEGNALWLTPDEFIATFRNSIQGGSPGGMFGVLGSPNVPDAALELHSSIGDQWPYRFHYGHQHAGWWELIYAGLDAGTPLRVSTNAAAEVSNQGGHIWFENGFFIGRWPDDSVRVITGSDIPPWPVALGTRVLKPNPGDYEGWIYTTGDWKGFGKIEA
jgi:hypothetical protein